MSRLGALSGAIRRCILGPTPPRPQLEFRIPGLFPLTRAGDQLRQARTYPVDSFPPSPLERMMVKTGFGGFGTCTVCGALTWWRIHTDNLRETGFCSKCNAVNRYRALAYLVCKTLNVELD